MSDQRLVIDEITPAYWRVTLDNPPLNLFDPEMFAELRLLMDRIEADDDLKVVVFDSAHPDHFIAHIDLMRFREIPDIPGAAPYTEWPGFVTRLAQSPVVGIASVRGRARGHGNEFLMACDIRFASREKAVFGQIEVGLGVVPGGGGTDWLCALVGRSRALEAVLGSDDIDAETAERWGWINRAVPDSELDAFTDRFARRIASFDRAALTAAKSAVNARAGIPAHAWRQDSTSTFLSLGNGPAPAAIVGRGFERGLQRPGDFERSLGQHLPSLNEQETV